MRWTVHWRQSAVGDILTIARTDLRQASRILSALDQFARTGSGDFRSLKGTDGFSRLRVGDWRVIIEIEGGGPAHSAVVVAIRNRRDAYD